MSEDDEEDRLSVKTDLIKKSESMLQLNPQNFEKKSDFVFFDFLSLYAKNFQKTDESKDKLTEENL